MHFIPLTCRSRDAYISRGFRGGSVRGVAGEETSNPRFKERQGSVSRIIKKKKKKGKSLLKKKKNYKEEKEKEEKEEDVFLLLYWTKKEEEEEKEKEEKEKKETEKEEEPDAKLATDEARLLPADPGASSAGALLRSVSSLHSRVDIRLHGKGNSSSHGARPVYYNIENDE